MYGSTASLVSGGLPSHAVVMHADAYLFAVLLWDVNRGLLFAFCPRHFRSRQALPVLPAPLAPVLLTLPLPHFRPNFLVGHCPFRRSFLQFVLRWGPRLPHRPSWLAPWLVPPPPPPHSYHQCFPRQLLFPWVRLPLLLRRCLSHRHAQLVRDSTPAPGGHRFHQNWLSKFAWANTSTSPKLLPDSLRDNEFPRELMLERQHLVIPKRPPSREVRDIISWIDCWIAYCQVVLTFSPSRSVELLKYLDLIVRSHRSFTAPSRASATPATATPAPIPLPLTPSRADPLTNATVVASPSCLFFAHVTFGSLQFAAQFFATSSFLALFNCSVPVLAFLRPNSSFRSHQTSRVATATSSSSSFSNQVLSARLRTRPTPFSRLP